MTRPVQGAFFKPDRKRTGRIRRTYDETLAELRRTDRIDKVDSALIGLARVLADEYDAANGDDDESRFVRMRVAGTYHAVLLSLLERTAGDAGSSDLDAMLAALLDPQDTEPPH